MATLAAVTPSKHPDCLLSPRVASERVPFTPSPRTPTRASDVGSESIHSGVNLTACFSKAVAKSQKRASPKSSISRSIQSPRKLELGISDHTLTGTGPPSTRRLPPRRERVQKPLTRFNGDRFIPNRTASEAICNVGTGKLNRDDQQTQSRPMSRASEGSSALANAASAFNFGGRGSEEDTTLSLEGLSIDDREDSMPCTKSPPDRAAYKSELASACGLKTNTRILAFKPAPPESSRPIDLRSQYNRPLKPAIDAKHRRRILTAPERVLDAPSLVDDYYLNLLDWSSGNQIAIGLQRNVYVWSAESGTVNSLLETSPETYISSVKWSGDGAYVGVGLGTGEVQIWDVEEGKQVRSMFGHDERVGVLGWNKHLLSTGARNGKVFNHDVRVAQHKVAELVSHAGEVCGLEWRADGAQLATGANDNLVNIWDARSLNAPKFTKTNHRAAVKALSWCPWQPNLLATGGGTHDRHIHFWNTTTGARTNSIDTGSQVTSLRWSGHYKEIVSSSGFPDNSLSIWSYPTLVKNVEIPAHESRVLHSCLSPDGQTLATAAADESLKFWKIFEKKPANSSKASTVMTIR